MKKLLLTLVALFAMSMSVCAQEGPKIWQGGPGKKYDTSMRASPIQRRILLRRKTFLPAVLRIPST